MKLIKYDLLYSSANEEASAFSIVHNHVLNKVETDASEDPEGTE